MMEVTLHLIRSALQDVIVMRSQRRVWTFRDGQWVELDPLRAPASSG